MCPVFDASTAPEEGGADFPKFELKTNEGARINLIGTKGWAVSVRHWVAKMGYVHCHAVTNKMTLPDLLKLEKNGGDPEKCLMCAMAAQGVEAVGSPQRRIALRILRYKTDLKGKVVPGDLSFWMEIWVISNQKYRDILNILKEWGGEDKKKIRNHDLLLTCDDEQYQKITITPMKLALWQKKGKEVKAYLEEEIPKFDLNACLGETIEVEALKRRFARISRSTMATDPVDTELDDIMDEAETETEDSQEGDFMDGLTDDEDEAIVVDDDEEEEKPKKSKKADTKLPKVVDEEEASEGDFLADLLEDED